MAIRAVPTVSEEIYLQDLSDRVKRLEGEDCPREEQAWVKVRQATEGDQLQVSQRYADSEVVWQADGSAKETRSTNTLEDRMFKAYLVLVDAGNITDKGDNPVFGFSEKGDYPKFKGTWSQFKEKWSVLPPAAASAIELALYKLNPQWDIFGLVSEDEEEGE
jgi:hypothetical protein